MKKALITSFLICISIFAFAGFEGVITTHVISNGGQMTTKWFVKNDQLKLQMNYQGNNGPVKVDMIMKKNSSKMIVITDTEDYKGYSEIDASLISSSLKMDGFIFSTNGISKEEVTKYQASNEQYQAAVWMLNLDLDLSPFVQFFKDDPAFILIAQKGVKGFPNKSILTNHNGELVYSLTVVSTESKSLSASEFDIPEGFEKKELVEIEPNK